MEINRPPFRLFERLRSRPLAKERGVIVRRVALFGRRRLARLSIRSDQQQFLPSMRRILTRYYTKRHAIEFVIEYDVQPVGYFQLNLSERETRHYAEGEATCGLEAMCVDARWQSRGIAVAALAQLPRVVSDHCPHVVRVNLTVDCRNDRAIRAYQRAGFRKTGAVIDVGGHEPQYVMSLKLSGVRT